MDASNHYHHCYRCAEMHARTHCIIAGRVAGLCAQNKSNIPWRFASSSARMRALHIARQWSLTLVVLRRLDTWTRVLHIQWEWCRRVGGGRGDVYVCGSSRVVSGTPHSRRMQATWNINRLLLFRPTSLIATNQPTAAAALGELAIFSHFSLCLCANLSASLLLPVLFI